MGREEYEKGTGAEGMTEDELEYARTHPDWLADMPPAPPEVTAGLYEGTRPEEAGSLPEEEGGARRS